jgi:hypothetical protein
VFSFFLKNFKRFSSAQQGEMVAGKEILAQMRMISPRISSPRQWLLLRPDAGSDSSPAQHSQLPRIVPFGQLRGLKESRFFDGRITTPRKIRLETPLRSRRVEAPTGAVPGKDELGVALPQRIMLKELQASPPRSPRYVNDATMGSVNLSYSNIESPSMCPKARNFSRFAVAVGRGGTFERSYAGCIPFSP